MKIMIVGNIFKDVYLDVDERSENFETDDRDVKWLNLSFDASEHHYFHRLSNFGGAVISMEVLHNMGVDASISGSKLKFDADGVVAGGNTVADLYRYILISDDQVSYFVPSFEHKSTFVAPKEPVDYIYIDRSANISDPTPIINYLKKNPQTKLVTYIRKNVRGEAEEFLACQSDIVFTERNMTCVKTDKVITIHGNKVHYEDIDLELEIPRTDLTTHLTGYSIFAATVLGGMAAGFEDEKSFHLAKVNVENSSLDATLSLNLMEELAA